MLEDALVLFRESGIRVALVNTNDCKAMLLPWGLKERESAGLVGPKSPKDFRGCTCQKE